MLNLFLFAAVAFVIVRLTARVAALEERLAGLEPSSSASVAQGAPPVDYFARSARPEPVKQSVGAEPTDRSAARRLDLEVEAPLPSFEEMGSASREQLRAEPLYRPVDPAPVEEVPAVEAEPRPAVFAFEELFGRKLPIWAGGVTLAVAGVLIVRYSIEAGLLSPLVRFLFGLAFGAGLIAAAEIALRNEHRVRDPRVRQALAGAGIASLYASILVAVNLYGLIDPFSAFIAMAAVTALAMGLSLRFGPPSALLGLVGGLAAPAMVGAGQPDVPLLTLYLALAVGGLSALSRAQRWTWLGVSALIGGLGWGAVLLVGGALDAASTVSIGFYVLLVGVAFPLFALPGSGAAVVRFAGSVAATAQIAALVATGGFVLLNWGLFGLISIAILLLSRREEGLRHLPVVGLALALLLLGAWTDPAPAMFALVATATATIYAPPLLLALWRPGGSLSEAGQIAGLALSAALLAAMHFHRADGSVDVALAAVALVAACLPAAAALLGLRSPDRLGDGRFALLVTAAALLVAVAAGFAAPAWLLPLLVGLVALALLAISLGAGDERIEYSGWAFAVGSVALLCAAPAFVAEADRLAGLDGQVLPGRAVLRWAGLSAMAALFAWRGRLGVGRGAAQAVSALFAYAAVSQVAPPSILPLVAAAGLLVLAAAARRLALDTLLPAMAALLALTGGWAVLPMLDWAEAALPALGGDPVLAAELPRVRDVLLRLLGPALVVAAALLMAAAQTSSQARRVGIAVAAPLGALAFHILFKQIFAIEDGGTFVALGLAERTLWEALIGGAAVAAWMRGYRQVGLGLCLAALAHFGAFSLLLHNPLWAEQAVGSVPMLNLLLPSYGFALALLFAAGRFEPELAARFERPIALLRMLLILLLAFSLLRQTAEGSILSVPDLSAGEDIGRSILAVLLAIGFLVWGIRSGARDWRIASLVLMLAAVAKVFLFDAAGLEGLMRIASFVALGFSLIGIGWLYSRSLGGVRPLSSSR